MEYGIPIENFLNLDYYTYKVYTTAVMDRGQELKNASASKRRN